MSAVLLSPGYSQLSGYLVNRFYPTGKLYVGSSEPMIESERYAYDKWFRFLNYNASGIDQEAVAESAQEMLHKIVEVEHSRGGKINAIFLFPNLYYNNKFVTITYESLLEAMSANFVVPLTIISGLYEFGVASVEMKVFVFEEEYLGFESRICVEAIKGGLEKFRKLDDTNFSKLGESVVITVPKDTDDAEYWMDSYCEKVLEKEVV